MNASQNLVINHHDIRRAIRKFPGLNSCGMTLSHPWNTTDRREYTDEELAETVAKYQRELLQSGASCTLAARWLLNLQPTKSANVSSYALKHYAEFAVGRYISNGEMIVAAVHLGLAIEHNGGPNVGIGVSQKSLAPWEQAYRQILPGGAADAAPMLTSFRKPIVFTAVAMPHPMCCASCAAAAGHH